MNPIGRMATSTDLCAVILDTECRATLRLSAVPTKHVSFRIGLFLGNELERDNNSLHWESEIAMSLRLDRCNSLMPSEF